VSHCGCIRGNRPQVDRYEPGGRTYGFITYFFNKYLKQTSNGKVNMSCFDDEVLINHTDIEKNTKISLFPFPVINYLSTLLWWLGSEREKEQREGRVPQIPFENMFPVTGQSPTRPHLLNIQTLGEC
jgi:hypothetical protein